jgi:hypothetical protein
MFRTRVRLARGCSIPGSDLPKADPKHRPTTFHFQAKLLKLAMADKNDIVEKFK